MLDFVALDFETANSYRGSPCAVGLIRFRSGEPVDERRWLIRPPEQVDYFAPFNVALHGVDAAAVKHAPRWERALPAIVDYIGQDVVVSHNAGFDIGVIRYACAVDNIQWPEMRFLCTLVMSRRALSLPSYRLPYVAAWMGFELDEHHDPLADARTAGLIAVALARDAGAEGLNDLAAAHKMTIGHMARGIYKGSVAAGSSGSRLSFPGLNPDADPDGYLFGRVVVFTGALMSMTRQVAWEECARVGAMAQRTPTRQTNVLVVGDINPAVLRPGSNITGKARKAFELQDKGQDIEVMTEDDFLRCLDGGDFDKFVLPEGGAMELTIKPADRARPLAARHLPAEPETPRPPRPLRREWVPTDQTCSVDGCSDPAMFRTRSRPTFCNVHIGAILWQGGLVALESFTHPNDYLLTRCVQCENVAHYRFEYAQQKIREGERTCRACYWRKWGQDVRRMQGDYAQTTPVTYAEAQAIAEANGLSPDPPMTFSMLVP